MLLEKIRQLYPQFTKSQKRLADFIANSYREAAFMTASQLARRLAVNEATVIRLAQKLGYPGYPELIQDVQEIVQQELKPYDETKMVGAAEDRFFAILNNEVDKLQRVISHMTPDLAPQALLMLRQAQRIIVVGQGISAPLAQLFSLSLRSVGLLAECPTSDPLNLALMVESVDEHCVVVAVEAATESMEAANALHYASQKGARTFALSWSPVSPAAQAAELAISYPAHELFGLPSIALTATLIDALVQSLAADDAEGFQARRERFAAAKEAILAKRRR